MMEIRQGPMEKLKTLRNLEILSFKKKRGKNYEEYGQKCKPSE
jgi:hypothetical protein